MKVTMPRMRFLDVGGDQNVGYERGTARSTNVAE
jgi:hypothetical protein